jgi:hypothetical protein
MINERKVAFHGRIQKQDYRKEATKKGGVGNTYLSSTFVSEKTDDYRKKV